MYTHIQYTHYGGVKEYLLNSELLPEAAPLLDPEHGGGEGARERVLADEAQARRLHARLSRLPGPFSLHRSQGVGKREGVDELIRKGKGKGTNNRVCRTS